MDFVDELFGPASAMDQLAEANRIEERQWVRDLVRLRRARGLSQEDVAALMGIGQSGVARIEAGGRDLRLSSLFRYALAVNAKVDHIVSRAEDDRAMVATYRLPAVSQFADESDDPAEAEMLVAPPYAVATGPTSTRAHR